MADRAFNFSSGPGTLPLAVLDAIRADLPVYGDTGASILEISHRSAAFTAVLASARARLRRLLGISDEWHVLFLEGGASMQFYQVPLNFLPAGGSADYLNTGVWATKAIHEARRFGRVNVAASSEATTFDRIPEPETWRLDPAAAYLHFTSNNTIYGTEFHATPHADVPLVCDVSSDFLSRPIPDLDRYGLLYAGAQKNAGPAGVTLVLVHDRFLARRNPDLPTILDYGTHAKSLYHTPPVFAVYAVEKVLAWLEGEGGLAAMDALNEQKAALLYGRIDRTGFYRGTVQPGSRSRMNVCFRLPTPDLDARFAAEGEAADLRSLKGYRTVGGVRASIYNAMPLAGVEALVAFMDAFEAQNG